VHGPEAISGNGGAAHRAGAGARCAESGRRGAFRRDPKFIGFGTDFHILCLDKSGQGIEGCEEWFTQMPHLFRPSDIEHDFDFKEIRHEVDFRVSVLWSYGDVVSDLRVGEESRRIWAMKLLGVYHYHFNERWELGVAAGAIPVFGGGSIRSGAVS
jgi:hypothetical protein